MLVLLLAGCTAQNDHRPPEPVGQQREELSALGVERAIPLRFIKMYDEAAPVAINDIALYAGAREMVDVANNVFKPAGVQFYIRAMVDCSNQTGFQFHYEDLRTPTTTHPNGNKRVFFAAAKPDLTCPFPAIASRADPYPGQEKEEGFWMDWATMEYAHESEIVVWLHKYVDFPSALYPWEGKGLHLGAGELADITEDGQRKWLLAHELGHTLGLSHSWDLHGAYVSGPGKINPRTGQTFRMSDFWDMVYEPGTSAADPHRFFNDRVTAAALEDGGMSLVPVHKRCTLLDSVIDSCSYLTGPDRVHCDVGQCIAYTEGYDSPAQQLGGIAFTYPTGVGVNLMSFLNPELDFEQGISASQARVIQSYLRFETTQDTDLSGHLGAMHGRTRLGTYVNREPTYELDFNGDLRRDIAWWTPPTATETFGRFHVRLSPSYSTTIELPFQLAQPGDIPVAADYDGDGRTNLALYRPGGGPIGDNPWDPRSYWIRCPSPATLTATTCWVGTTSVQFGDREDVPLPGLDFDGNATTAHYAVFRPGSSSRFVWAPVSNPASTTVRYMGTQGSVPLAGLIDDDNRTDVVVYEPANAYFHMGLSSDDWLTGWGGVRHFPSSLVGTAPGTASQRSAGVVVRGMINHRFVGNYVWGAPVYEPRMALSMFSPFDGNWYVNWTPMISANPSAACQWGTYRDLPLGGIGSSRTWRTSQAYSQLAVYRSDNSVAGADAMLAFRSSICGAAQPTRYPSTGTSRSMVFPVRDMTGDLLPELVVVDPDNSNARFLTSNSGYANSTYGTLTLPVVQLGNQRAVFL